mmetsp:Transcript_8397/g.27506  ORF Transcript_8397/g.27506 Transcript_8397/m.27506 type:complete len:148 (-) Transcript_8397:104-547(-)|eukprot:CAMPEP_0118910720 /NCGR_PEP_ID=MMETSP1166-20130328/12738_1 /TAXON_ID=1104430 /ORGANISM="Chrysoreinhardia sp, Strain CCMP3193" /LENGTH=147 /DNA_ID=CAMNT_0006850191 /DNA_START=28 /DNA_END=471 /DNA_ORIENTATION=+
MEGISSYSWDQSAKAVTVYVPSTGRSVDHSFEERGFTLRVDGRELKVANLCKAIDAAKSRVTVKADRVQVKLWKRTPEDWSDLTDAKDRRDAERKERVANGDLKDASTRELLADLYKHSTDDERDMLKDAALEGQRKREKDLLAPPS